MKKLLILLSAISLLCFTTGCGPQEARVMARFVPERYDDFVFENDLVAGRLYGEALESCGKGQITSPGVDVWVKTPGALVANQRYIDDLQNGKSYHKNWGNGKDCYKVGRSLGAGASSPIENGVLQLPATNFRSWEIVEDTPGKVVFTLSYPEWTTQSGVKVSLEKTFTVTPGTYFTKCEDRYSFTGADSIVVAAGFNRHPAQETIESEMSGADRCAIWEKASDQSIESEDGMLGIAVVMPLADAVYTLSDMSHAVCCKKIASGEILTYCFGSCWTGGNVKTAGEWFEIVNEQ